MQRAVIAIGVKKTGGLPELQAAVESATLVAAWAREQKIPANRVKLITDAKSAVSRDRLFDAVDAVAKLGFIEQLIVYFSGHGINSGMFEQWLLSKAPDDPAAAVDVKGSEFGARFCGIGHIVFVSDACRTAADSIQAQRVTGSSIFPNVPPAGLENPVDQFYATLVGNPAFEVKTVQEAVSRYRAAYTTVLMDALHGKVPALVEVVDGRGYVRPRPLKRHLATAVPAFFGALHLPGGESSQPDARIESDSDAWIADVPPPPAAAPPATGAGSKRARPGVGRAVGARRVLTGDEALPPLGAQRRETPMRIASDVLADLRGALAPSRAADRRKAAVRRARATPVAEGDEGRRYDALLAAGQVTFGPDHMESECGIKVRGARIDRVVTHGAQAQIGVLEDVVMVSLEGTRKGANVLVCLADGSAVVAPAFRDFITGLSFNGGGQLDDVWCEPSNNTARWREYESAVGEIRRLRAIIAASTALGVFRMDDPDDAALLLERFKRVNTIDPALAVYAAYAFNDRRLRSEIVALQRRLDETLRARVFDVAMLAFSLGRGRVADAPDEMYPCVPMLTQGWSLLGPLGITLPDRLAGLRGDLRPSLWTHFNRGAVARLEAVIKEGK